MLAINGAMVMAEAAPEIFTWGIAQPHWGPGAIEASAGNLGEDVPQKLKQSADILTDFDCRNDHDFVAPGNFICRLYSALGVWRMEVPRWGPGMKAPIWGLGHRN